MTKYGAKPTTIQHAGKPVKCASQFEAKCLGELILLLRAGKIDHLKFHPRYQLYGAGRAKIATYVADAEFTENGKVVVYEAKGMETAVWKLKRKLFEANYPDHELRVVKK